MAQLDRLTSQLAGLAEIIGQLGLSIATAQKEFNLDYVNSLSRLAQIVKEVHAVEPTVPAGATEEEKKRIRDDVAAARASMDSLLRWLAPPRYRFTETTLDFSADLSERRDTATQAGLSLGVKGVMLSAATARSFGYDYKAAARITCVLESRDPDDDITKMFLARAKEIREDKLALPQQVAPVDKDTKDAVAGLMRALADRSGIAGAGPAGA